jgi:hypothetical protein
MVLFPEECLFLFRECFSLENQGDDFAGKSALLKKTSLLFQEWPFPENFRPYFDRNSPSWKILPFLPKEIGLFFKRQSSLVSQSERSRQNQALENLSFRPIKHEDIET